MIARPLFVDGHVHVHDGFTWDAVVEAALLNFTRAGALSAARGSAGGCLVLTEPAGAEAFCALAAAGRAPVRGWSMEVGDDGCSVVLRREPRDALVIVAGRQIATLERLEVLAVGTVRRLPDGRPIREILAAVTDAEAVPVVPWGLGKWAGARGRIVQSLLDDPALPWFCLGDNGGRARSLPAPALFGRAEAIGRPVIGGSDPLPMRRQVHRIGSYGFLVEDWPETARAGEALVRRIRAMTASPPAFGSLSSMSALIGSQVRLRWRRVGRLSS